MKTISKRYFKVEKIFLIIILALVLRLISINQSIWLDEAISINVAKMPLFEIVKRNSLVDFHPPTYYWFLNLWTKVLGDNIFILRLSSVLFSLITIYFTYLSVWKYKNKKSGIIAALFLSLNPLFLYYSQELRMYSMTTMWLTIGLYYFLKIKNGDYKKKDLVLFNLMMALSFASFYGSIFMIMTYSLYFLIKKRWKLFFLTNIGIVLSIIFLSPLLFIQIKNSKVMLEDVKNWTLVLGKVNLKNMLLIPIKFNVGRIAFYPKKYYYLLAGTWTAILGLIAMKNSFKNRWIAGLLLFPLFFAILFSIKTPLLDYFRFLYLLPIFCLLLAINCNKKWQQFLVGGGFLFFSMLYLLNNNYHREDWKGVVSEIKKEKKVYLIATFSDPIKYYNPLIEIHDLKNEVPLEKYIWVIPYGEEVHGINLEEKLINAGYEKTYQKNFREMELEKWEK